VYDGSDNTEMKRLQINNRWYKTSQMHLTSINWCPSVTTWKSLQFTILIHVTHCVEKQFPTSSNQTGSTEASQ